MDRIIKVFASGRSQRELAAGHEVIASYDAFVVVAATEEQAAALAGQALTEDITDQYTIPLGGEVQATVDTFTPRITTLGATAEHPDYADAEDLGPGPHHYLVQFVGPAKQEWRDAVTSAGGEIVDVHSGFTDVVRADAEQVARIAALDEVRWVGHLPAPARLDVDAAPLPRTRMLPGALVVEFYTAREAAAARGAVRELGMRITADESGSGILVVEEPDGSDEHAREVLEALSRVHGVRTVRRRPMNRISNDVATGIMRAVPPPAAIPALDGAGETVGICDTGFDIGTTSPAHPDFTGRVTSVISYPITPDFAVHIRNPGADDGAADLDSGHGTHVAGSAVGDGTAAAALAGQATPVRGLAHKAKLVFQAVEQALDWRRPQDLQRYGRYLLAGIPADITRLFADAYAKGVRVHSNSWGGGDPGAYDSQCRQLDDFVWRHPLMCILVAAGNDGSDADGDGAINPGSVTSPGTAKNCITVGASENLRRGFDSQTYGRWWPDDYPVAPYKTAPMADDPQQVVAFSSRGPTADGRTKPDVVAPGTWILSTKSTMLSSTATGWAPFPASRRYFYMGGTSMATPLTAGAVAALRQHLRRDRRIANPSAALLKAVLIAGADRLPGTAVAGACVDNHQGYGRVDVAAVVDPGHGVTLGLQQNRTLTTGRSRRTSVTVTASDVALRVTLVYSDFPGATLVNNLNLLVTAPDGTRHVGNQAPGAPQAFDNANNVEVVHVPSPTAGAWTVEVIGANVPRGPQPYALVVRGKTA